MSTITIKRELPAIRCDICHQADCFAPETDVCTRCADMKWMVEPVGIRSTQHSFLETLSEFVNEHDSTRDELLIWMAFLPGGIALLALAIPDSQAVISWLLLPYVLSLIFASYGLWLWVGKDFGNREIGILLAVFNGCAFVLLSYLFGQSFIELVQRLSEVVL